jgi:hypothetical protein
VIGVYNPTKIADTFSGHDLVGISWWLVDMDSIPIRDDDNLNIEQYIQIVDNNTPIQYLHYIVQFPSPNP